MGAKFSRKRRNTLPPRVQLAPNPQYEVDLESYEAASELDPRLHNFGITLQDRTSKFINKVALGVEVRALTIDSLREVTDILLEMNQEVVKVILDSKKHIWKNEDMFNLVEDYFENSLQTLDFCNALKNCAQQARRGQLIIHVAIQRFEEEFDDDRYQRALRELEHFKSTADPFTEEFFTMFQNVYKQQLVMLQKLQLQKRKLDKRLKKFKTWRRVSNMIFVAAMVAVLICSVVAAAITAPPVVSAMAAASAVPLGSVGSWINSVWKGYENGVNGQRETLSSTQIGTYISIKDLDTIRALVNRLQVEIESLSQSFDLAMQQEETVNLVIQEIKGTVSVFINTIDDLSTHAERCSHDIKMARTAVLQRIIKNPGN